MTNKQKIKRRISDYLLGVTSVTTLIFAYLWLSHQCGPCGEVVENKADAIAEQVTEKLPKSEVKAEKKTPVHEQGPEKKVQETLTQHSKEVKKEVKNEEEELWALADKNKTFYSYNRYLKNFPEGKHKQEAIDGIEAYKKANEKVNKKLKDPERQSIDTEVLLIFNKTKNKLPPMTGKMPASGKPGKLSKVSIKNDTQYTLTLLYSGSESKKIVIPKGQTKNFSLANGPYRVAAKVDAPDIGNFVKTENLKGLNYSSIFYIQD